MERVLYQKLLEISEEHERLNERMSTQEVAADPTEYAKVAKAQSDINGIVRCFDFEDLFTSFASEHIHSIHRSCSS